MEGITGAALDSMDDDAVVAAAGASLLNSV
jgi:hypothetical protein